MTYRYLNVIGEYMYLKFKINDNRYLKFLIGEIPVLEILN